MLFLNVSLNLVTTKLKIAFSISFHSNTQYKLIQLKIGGPSKKSSQKNGWDTENARTYEINLEL